LVGTTLRGGDAAETMDRRRSRSAIIAVGSMLGANWLPRSITFRYIASIVGGATYRIRRGVQARLIMFSREYSAATCARTVERSAYDHGMVR
jgi:hypothetical protein